MAEDTTMDSQWKASDYQRRDGSFQAFTMLGCYPIFYLTKGNDVLCAECADDNEADPDEYDPVDAADVHWEGPPLRCDNCSNEIESAYGNPEEEKHNEQLARSVEAAEAALDESLSANDADRLFWRGLTISSRADLIRRFNWAETESEYPIRAEAAESDTIPDAMLGMAIQTDYPEA